MDSKVNFLAIVVDGCPMRAAERRNCLITYKFGNIPLHMNVEVTLGGKPIEIAEESVQFIEPERIESNREVGSSRV